jgi:hypothetical protein
MNTIQPKALSKEYADKIQQGRRFTFSQLHQTLFQGTPETIERTRYVIYRIKQELAKRGLPFVQVSPSGPYGIPKNKEEAQYALARYGMYIQYLAEHSMILYGYAEQERILPESFAQLKKFELPSFATVNV